MVAISPLLVDIVRRLVKGRMELDVVAMLETRESLLDRVRSLAPELIVIRLNAEEDDAIAAALACRTAGVRVLAFAHDASQISLYEAGRPVRTLTDLSPDELISALARV